jgi:hypothetical protein
VREDFPLHVDCRRKPFRQPIRLRGLYPGGPRGRVLQQSSELYISKGFTVEEVCRRSLLWLIDVSLCIRLWSSAEIHQKTRSRPSLPPVARVQKHRNWGLLVVTRCYPTIFSGHRQSWFNCVAAAVAASIQSSRKLPTPDGEV